ncbi:hypothetical protein C8Q74DRAFT_712700 [Fomes fomentarius]|nr:hypothetical protein C8Q74DRAFT_712700 [Fomes fomentarius]
MRDPKTIPYSIHLAVVSSTAPIISAPCSRHGRSCKALAVQTRRRASTHATSTCRRSAGSSDMLSSSCFSVPLLPCPSPIVPLEVIEEVVDLIDDVPSLLTLCVTNRCLLPRSRARLISTIHLHTRDQCEKLRTYLEHYAFLRPFVRAISITPSTSTSVIPVLSSAMCLIKDMPNLRHLHLSTLKQDSAFLSFPPIHLVLLRLYSVVEDLRIGPLEFASCAEFARLIRCFSTRLHRLRCTGISFTTKTVDMDFILKAHTRHQVALRTLVVSVPGHTRRTVESQLY